MIFLDQIYDTKASQVAGSIEFETRRRVRSNVY